MNVGEVCNREVVVIGPDGSITEAVQLMREYHVGALIVAEKRAGLNVPVGILTDRDIVIEILARQLSLDAVAVRDVMSHELLIASETDELADVLKHMRARGVRRVPVVDRHGALSGILTVDDIIELITEELTDLVRLISKEQAREQQSRA